MDKIVYVSGYLPDSGPLSRALAVIQANGFTPLCETSLFPVASDRDARAALLLSAVQASECLLLTDDPVDLLYQHLVYYYAKCTGRKIFYQLSPLAQHLETITTLERRQKNGRHE